MSTNKVALREVEQFMADFVPVNSPIFPLFMAKSQAYSQVVGKLDFRRVEAVGDIRNKHITPKDTEIKQISVMEGKKTFKKYFLASQFISSGIQDTEGAEEIVKQVLDENMNLMDTIFMTGEGTSASTMLNNGLYWSNDANYTLENSVAVEEDADDNYLAGLHTRIMATAEKADQVAGRKVLFVYGSLIKPLFDGVYPTGVRAFKSVLGEVLGSQWSLVKIPDASTPSGANGWIAANMDQVKLHYTLAPSLLDQGYDGKNMEYWFNFLMGSCMLEVLAKNGIVRQPATLSDL